MRGGLRIPVLLCWMLCVSSAVRAGSGQFEFTEQAGPYVAGFRVVEQYDYTRTWRPTTDALGRPFTGERARPLQTLIWYPAEGAGPRMSVGDYEGLLSTETSFATPTTPTANAQILQGLKPVLSTSLRAVRDAHAVSGHFPVVIYAPGFSSVAWENADLCEYLASHGYVVIASPSMGATTRSMSQDLTGLDAQARDISFLIGYAKSVVNADSSQVAIIGFSWGGLANLFAAARDNRIGALVSLDGSMRLAPAFVQKAADVHPEQMTIPMLSIAGAPMTLEYEERVLDPAHRQGPNVLNEWTHGDLTSVYLLGFVHWQHASMHQRNEYIWANYFPQMRQADYDRDEAVVGYGWLARYTRAFLDGYLKHDAAGLEFLERSPAENGVPRHFLSANFRPASGSPVSFAAFRAELIAKGFRDPGEIYSRLQKQSPHFELDANDLNDWCDELLRLHKLAEASSVANFNAQLHPANEGVGQRLAALARAESQSAQSKSQPLPPDRTLTEVAAERVDAIFAQWNRSDSPGCALAVVHDGRILYTRGYGMADLSHGVPIDPTTPFHVASVSKQFTAAALILLEEQGKLSLDDDVRRFVPELHDFGARITLRHLLHHSSGLRDQWGLLVLAGYRYSLDLITDEDVMNLVSAQRELNFAPGSKFMYSNTGFTLAAQTVKRVSGQSLRQFTTENLFGPLGMTSTHFRDDHAEINRGEAWGYVPAPGGAFRLALTNFDTVGPTSLYTTVLDLAKWDENFYEPRIGGRDFTARMTHLDPLNSGGANYFAMGLMMLRYRGLPIVEHSGGDAGYRSEILRFPQQHFSVICLCNSTTSAPELARKVADLYLAGQFPQASSVFSLPERSSSFHLAPDTVQGIYRSRETGIIMRLDVVDGVLHTVTSGAKVPLRTDGHGRFLVPEALGPGHFEPSTGKATRFVTQGEGEPAEVWDRLPAYGFPPDASQALAGTYYSSELDTSYRIVNRDDRLWLERKKYPPEVLTAIAPDLFAGAQGGTVQFTHSAQGAVTGLLVTGSRIQNLQFSRTQ